MTGLRSREMRMRIADPRMNLVEELREVVDGER
jgi:hypothetical protein